jgi:hypothetical protein
VYERLAGRVVAQAPDELGVELDEGGAQLGHGAHGGVARARVVEKLHLGRFAGPAGEVHHRTGTKLRQAAFFKALAMPEPPHFLHLAAAPADA